MFIFQEGAFIMVLWTFSMRLQANGVLRLSAWVEIVLHRHRCPILESQYFPVATVSLVMLSFVVESLVF
jgi:hypothetical protein